MDEYESPKGELPRWLMTFEEELDQRVLVTLRDGKKFVGYLKSFDQFGNVALDDCIELFIAEHRYAELHMGPMIIRGDNIVLFGEVAEGSLLPLQLAPLDEILSRQEELGINGAPLNEMFDLDGC